MRFLATLVAGLCFATLASAANFPALTGRVVDNAHLLSPQAAQRLTDQLAAHEAKTSNQVVVVTLPSLKGQEIEEYGYQLGREWGIGQKGKNNGVLLIVAPKERVVRIEVGYGLEGQLTDAMSSQIVQGIILPQFRAGKMENGILDGTQAILTLLSGESVLLPPATTSSGGDDSIVGILMFAFFILVMFSQLWLALLYAVFSVFAYLLSLLGFNAFRRFLSRMRDRIVPANKSLLVWLLTPTGRITGSGGGSFRGGFTGGGGSFGGGGSTGRW